jgi:capsular polysaccharide transport system permease protein
MDALREGWFIQSRVIKALMIRELTTRFGRENIGFLWIMGEPLLFAGLVGLLWTFMKGPEEHGVGIVAFVASGYIPLTFMRHSFSRCSSVFVANGSLMYHRQIKLMDFLFVRVLIEFLGAMMAWVFIALVLGFFGLFPVPADLGMVVAGWLLYALFVLSVCSVIAPLSEISELVEKLMPVSVYIALPFSGTFTMVSWLTPSVQDIMMMSPMVNAVEMMRYGIFGDLVRPYYNVWNPLGVSMVMLIIGLALCRHVRRTLVVE